MARIELGHDKVQGLDYYYTIHGWLKGINAVADSNVSVNLIDPDRPAGAPANYKRIGFDQFALALGYYQGDYERVDGNNTQYADESIWSNYTADIQAPSSPPGGYKYGLYNGNITYMANSIYSTPVSTHPFTNGRTQSTVYKYDQLNRIKNSIAYNGYGRYKNNDHPYEEYYHYDPNGNIDTLKRYDGTGTLIDNLAYRYQHNKKHNQLVHVDDAVSSGVSSVDVDDQGTALTDLLSGNLTGNYQYDEIGNLIQDNAEEIDSIHWNIYGKISYIKRNGASTLPDLKFLYNAAGERVMKAVMPKSAPGVIADEADWTYTVYARGADGNVLNTVTSADNSVGHTNEFVIYGSSRLGTWSPVEPEEHIHGLNALGNEYRLMGKKNYELTNHLGNVMATVSDKKFNAGSPLIAAYYAEVTSSQDYYPFGMLMPGRGYNTPDYRYAFNGKEKDDEVKNTSGTQYDYGFRVYDPRLGKFLSVDPLFSSYPWLSTYQFAENCPIQFVDIDGRESGWIDAGMGRQYMSSGDIGNVYRRPLDIEVKPQPKQEVVHQQELRPSGAYTSAEGQMIVNNQVEMIKMVVPGSNLAYKKAHNEEITKGDVGFEVMGVLPIGKIAGKVGGFASRTLLRSNMMREGIDMIGKHAHHIITYTRGGSHELTQLAAKAGFDINSVENGIALEEKFHIQFDEGKLHPEYSQYMQNQLNNALEGLKKVDGLTPENAKGALTDIINETRGKIEQGIKDGAKTLDDVFKSKKE